MSLITVCQDVCEVVGVMKPQSIFSGLATSRTQQELLALANEMAQRIAFDTRDWRKLKAIAFISSADAIASEFNQVGIPLPSDFKRMLLTSQVYRKSVPAYPLAFIADDNNWTQRRLMNYISHPYGEWTLGFEHLYVSPAPPDYPKWLNNHAYTVGDRALDNDELTPWVAAKSHTSAASGLFAADRAANPTYWTAVTFEIFVFNYLRDICIQKVGGTDVSDVFTDDGDTFVLPERLLKLGMVWQWKAQKGTPYAEDMGNYEDALAREAGADTPAPIIVGHMPISSSARVAFPWPADWGSVTK